jgi:hypothetical protein
MNPLKRYVANPVVSCGDEEDGAVLFNPDTDDTVIVNLTGRTLWAFLETPRTVDEMAAHLVQTYRGVQAEQAAEDADQFVQSLLSDFLLEVDDDA